MCSLTGTGNFLISSIGSNSKLAKTARENGIEAYVITNPGHRGPVSDGVLATTVETIIGAIYLVSGKDMATVKESMAVVGLMTRMAG